MHTENTIVIDGSTERIFALGAATENWPRILPHYRKVDILSQSDDGRNKLVTMSAVRDNFPFPGFKFPVRWKSEQRMEPENGKIFFVHTGGIARGMVVVWELTPDPSGGVHVAIKHDLAYPLAFLNGWFAQELVGRIFIQSIASRTLATIKKIVESEPKA